MKAAVFRGPHRPLELADVPTPTPGAGEVLVKVAGCGLCHTDLHYVDHAVKTFKPPPLILGHEAAGTVAALGPETNGCAVGDRVLIPAVLSCGRCGFCREGRENLCTNLVMLGNNVDGAYAEYVAVPAKDLVAVPPGLALERACVIADAISTPYHAVKHRGRVRVGDQVAVVGCGGVGLNVVQCAAAAGARVIAVDLNADRLELARTLGAADTVNPRDVERLDQAVRKLTDGGVDVAFEAIGTPATIELAFSLLRRGGRLCVIGYSAEPVKLSAARLMYYELEIAGSLGCGAGEYPEILALVGAGKIKLDPIVSGTVALAAINEGLDRLRRGEGVRWVVIP
ncbi:MAG TPA: zinc-binding dehydrogenase [Gemmatimonadales bacterium]|nr:zinc-binding dehydrogenase [Gemmatimonadales bacterium]